MGSFGVHVLSMVIEPLESPLLHLPGNSSPMLLPLPPTPSAAGEKYCYSLQPWDSRLFQPGGENWQYLLKNRTMIICCALSLNEVQPTRHLFLPSSSPSSSTSSSLLSLPYLPAQHFPTQWSSCHRLHVPVMHLVTGDPAGIPTPNEEPVRNW